MRTPDFAALIFKVPLARADQDDCGGGDGEAGTGVDGATCAVFLAEATNISIAETSAIQKP